MQDLERSLRELQRTQGELIQAQKMEAIGRLAGGIAHDFNNLLTAIGGYAQLLLERFAGSDPARADLEEIKKATGKAGALTRQLLAFSRKQVLQPRVLDLNEVITNMQAAAACRQTHRAGPAWPRSWGRSRPTPAWRR
jgi:C4-dicarboxylate-specific signal transduction histidine kinase